MNPYRCSKIEALENERKELKEALDDLQRRLEENSRLQRKEEQALKYAEKQLAKMDAKRQEEEADKLAESESASRSVLAATDIPALDWFKPQLLITYANQLSSYASHETKFNVRFDHRTKIYRIKNDKGVKTYAVWCKTVLGNDVVVLYQGEIIW